jgi:hypothetical protein
VSDNSRSITTLPFPLILTLQAKDTLNRYRISRSKETKQEAHFIYKESTELKFLLDAEFPYLDIPLHDPLNQ